MSDWWKRSVVYQIYPKSFCDGNGDGIGDLPGILSKLDYLSSLGVDVLWLSPICDSPDRDNGYDVREYLKIQPAYGTMEDYETLIREAHRRHLKVVFDLVANHTSDQYPWFQEALQDPDSPRRDYYYFRPSPNNWHAVFGGSAWTYRESADAYSLASFSPYQPDLNWSNPALRQEFYRIMRFWIEKGVDGFRLDAVGFLWKDPSLPDTPDGAPQIMDPCIHDYLQEMYHEVLASHDLLTAGENSGLTVEDMRQIAGPDRHELNMMIQFFHVEEDLGEHGKWNPGNLNFTHLKRLFDEQQQAMDGAYWTALYWSNHDQPRAVSRIGSEDPRYRERSAKMIAVNTFCMMGTPFVYQGEELGMTNYPYFSRSELRDLESLQMLQSFPENGIMTEDEAMACIRAKGRDNARTPMQWDTSANAGFTTGKPWIAVNPNYREINAEDQLRREDSVFHFYQELIAFRKSHEILISGHYHGVALDDPQVFAYIRTLNGDSLLVITNWSDSPAPFNWARYLSTPHPEILIGNLPGSRYVTDKVLEPYEAIVLARRS